MSGDKLDNQEITITEEDIKNFKSKQNKLPHQSDQYINKLSNVIITSIFRGALYGALISIPTELLLRWRSPFYRTFGLRIRIFYHTIWMSAGASFHAEREVMRFEQKVRIEEEIKREKLIEYSITNGFYSPDEDDAPLPGSRR
ncbi:hypothetical protein B5S31_g5617 [[Candida] boidinii]|uniref:Unnamed protein product n=1 Tax=Candida boidinii TaxID=5477 RepID=A0ACB5TXV5_CANBO|nr:hypothetical protein B5S29_g5526 [[Candida] boidinii]OWB75677.1 hypothetical protein B5S31_g5617 [[Candida] boidinii]OWB81303.1 hypothetical protein B5S32_g5709 [[Candida] boidinii]GME97535.1 unnamed protein product [[Candida] boidinii]GMF64961.1 unnamed protein product [[Candida] boidinii]